MNSDSTLSFYQELGFEEIDIEDGHTAFFIETDENGNYALLTNDNGELPKQLRQTVFFACYSSQDAFQWSASFKNSYLFKDTWTKSETLNGKLEAIRLHRQETQTF